MNSSPPPAPRQALPHGRRIAVVGLGYVGLPVAVAFGRGGERVVGFDINEVRVAELRAGRDRTNEVTPDELAATTVHYTASAEDLQGCDFYIITVPTPIDPAKRPDLMALTRASELVGSALTRGSIVVYESTVFPGATEEHCLPILERVSGLRSPKDFAVGYSPERINPGDRDHRFETIQKVVSGQTPETLEIVAAVYDSVVYAGVHRAPSIKVAEAAKVIENTQRDLNIALMNELSVIFDRIGIDTADVLTAAGTKWNFLPFKPGLVGGHCIGVDPYYLTHRAEIAGYHPEIILAGRRINDSVGSRIAEECARLLMKRGTARGRIALLGLTFKEDVPDLRNSKVVDIVRGLERFGSSVTVHDPHADPAEALSEYGIVLEPIERLKASDAVVLAVSHRTYVEKGWDLIRQLLRNEAGVVIDVKSSLDRENRPSGVTLWRL
ncbi:nucleotide sugar dehydrogenase [Rhodopseudomonas palustris]|uniref:nucleotide sugar dehydrogenase n=1 Tax=Rhodopseudomonas palustris TaxID=1076 RepID=UPI0022F11B71|nr:nucleotide sugar dehydrogenase [Rhodopseudomonas palustris]WBU31260.1 nucleotide sugar dehydrogenase [Rhodopseudomonas palustris]